MGAPGMGCERTKGSPRQETSPGGRRRCRDASEVQAGAKDQLEHLVLRKSEGGAKAHHSFRASAMSRGATGLSLKHPLCPTGAGCPRREQPRGVELH